MGAAIGLGVLGLVGSSAYESSTATAALDAQLEETCATDTGVALGAHDAAELDVYDGLAADINSLTDINTNRQAMIGIPVVKATGGRYEPLAITNRLATLLPEFGKDIGTLHTKLYNQVLVTVQRKAGLTGPLQNPQVELKRPGITGQVSLDGLP